jgi:putative transposase
VFNEYARFITIEKHQKMSADNYFINDQNAVYYLTFTIVDWVDVFTRKEYKFVVADSLNYCIEHKGLEVFAWCLMSNHLHLVCRAIEDSRISDIIRDFKKFTAKTILDKIITEPESRRDCLPAGQAGMLYRFEFAGKFDNRIKKYRFWQDTNHAIQLDNTEMIEQRINYTHDNPVRAMIVGRQEDYLYSSARDYSGEKVWLMFKLAINESNKEL